jgi:DNA-binding NarL/FixJ family response regulator
VLVIEDDPVVRQEVAARIGENPRFEVGVEADTLAAARQALATHKPVIAVVDLQLPDGNAIELIPELRAAGVAVLVLTVVADDANVYRALAAGAGGYLLKAEAMSTLDAALASLVDGGAPISPRIARWLMEDFRARAAAPTSAPGPELSPREWELIDMFSNGATYSEVARALAVSINTVREHVRNLYEKLHVCSKAEAVLRARSLDTRGSG